LSFTIVQLCLALQLKLVEHLQPCDAKRVQMTDMVTSWYCDWLWRALWQQSGKQLTQSQIAAAAAAAAAAFASAAAFILLLLITDILLHTTAAAACRAPL
jgi:hypothetical protein